MITVGVILLVIGFVASMPIVWSIGMILLVLGLLFWVLGVTGHAVAGHRHYY